MTAITRRKLMIAGVGCGLLIVSYLAIKYVLPLMWPFILAYGLAVVIYPSVRFLRDKLHFHKNAATCLVLIFAIAVFTTVLIVLADKILQQIMAFADRWPYYEEKLLGYLKDICGTIERTFKIKSGEVYGNVCDGVINVIDSWQGKIMPVIMNNSIHTLVVFVDVLIFIALTVMAVFYMTRDMDKLKEINKNNLFYEEIRYLRGLVSRIVKAYIKTQLIIISVVAAICSLGLAIIGNSYYILLGIIIGIMDALPLIGVGAVVIPWSIVYVFMGEYLKAAIMFTIFIICYLVRELLEAKLMGLRIGISPIASLISIYVGYRLFGFLGMMAGPLVYVLVREVISGYGNPGLRQ